MRIRSLLTLLGNPERGLRAIHVAGSNGKGSVCRMLESVLVEQGYRVGMFISPHLVDFRERYRLNGEMASKGDLLACTPALYRALRVQAGKKEGAATYFEAITALAFLYFKRKKIDFAVLETGLGGRFDSTNVMARPLLTVITNISLEHTQILGKTEAKIAWEKAGILKAGAPLVNGATGVARGVILRQFRRVQGKRRAGLWDMQAGRAWRLRSAYEDAPSQSQTVVMEVLGERRVLALPLLGAHQHQNLACALGGIEALRDQGIRLDEQAVLQGLARADWPGRLQVLGQQPLTILDGAHNPAGAKALGVEMLRIKRDQKAKRVAMAVGVLKDKDWKRMFEYFAGCADRFFVATPPDERGLNAGVLAAWLKARGKPAQVCKDLPQALKMARGWAGKRGMAVLAGSLYSVGAVLKKGR